MEVRHFDRHFVCHFRHFVRHHRCKPSIDSRGTHESSVGIAAKESFRLACVCTTVTLLFELLIIVDMNVAKYDVFNVAAICFFKVRLSVLAAAWCLGLGARILDQQRAGSRSASGDQNGHRGCAIRKADSQGRFAREQLRGEAAKCAGQQPTWGNCDSQGRFARWQRPTARGSSQLHGELRRSASGDQNGQHGRIR